MSNAAASDSGFKVRYALRTVFIILAVALMAGHVTSNFQYAFGIFIAFHSWSLLWIKILARSPNIYAIRVPTMFLDDWIPLSLPSNDDVSIKKDRVVASISEISGIRGAHPMIALRIMTVCLNMILLASIQADMHHRGSTLLSFKTREDLVPVLMTIQCIGQFLLGHFELNLVDSAHATGHYMGVVLLLIGSCNVGLTLNWNAASIFLIALEYGLCVLWFWYCGSIEMRSSDIKVVTYRSKMCIGIELVMFIVTNTLLVVSVYASGQNEGNFWVSPFL